MTDDRNGVLTNPAETTVVQPGETICNTDIGLPVSYVVQPADAGTTITNNAVVTVPTGRSSPGLPGQRHRRGPHRRRPRGDPADGANAVSLKLLVGSLVLAAGSALLILGRRRSAH